MTLGVGGSTVDEALGRLSDMTADVPAISKQEVTERLKKLQQAVRGFSGTGKHGKGPGKHAARALLYWGPFVSRMQGFTWPDPRNLRTLHDPRLPSDRLHPMRP